MYAFDYRAPTLHPSGVAPVVAHVPEFTPTLGWRSALARTTHRSIAPLLEPDTLDVTNGAQQPIAVPRPPTHRPSLHKAPVDAPRASPNGVKYITNRMRVAKIAHAPGYYGEERKARIRRFMEKRARRTWGKRIRYADRQEQALRQNRIHGRFVSGVVESNSR